MNSSKGAALVTGASQGLGKAIALRLARDGYPVAVNDISSKVEAVDALVAQISGDQGRAISILGDASSEEDVKAMIARTVAELGNLVVFVANAGIVRPEPLLTTSLETWDLVMNVNARGVFLGYREAAKQMIEQGKGGCIIGASSMIGKKGSSVATAYATSKFAVRGLTQCAARELGKHNIRVNAYAPGPIDTAMWVGFDTGFSERTGQPQGTLTQINAGTAALGRIGAAEDVANVVSFLASQDSRHITGQTINVDGGINFD